MFKVKNICAGILIIADAGLKLQPGESTTLEKATAQTNKALANGLLAEIKTEEPPVTDKPELAKAIDLSKLEAAEAISKVNSEADPATLKGYLETEKRRSVLDALKSRLTEVDSAAS